MFYNVENNFRSYEEDFKSAGSLEAKFNIMKELAHDINSLRDSIMDDGIGSKKRDRKIKVNIAVTNLYNKLYSEYRKNFE